MEFAELVVSAGGFFAIHIGVAGTALRDKIALRFGGAGFQILFSIMSFLLLIWMIASYRIAPGIVLWDIQYLHWLPVLLSPFAAIFLVAAYSSPNATAAGGGKALRQDNPDRGIFRVTRHPLLMGIALWAFAHMAANGDVASLILFGSIFATSVFGPASIDAKLKRRAPEAYENLAKVTAIIPFAAIVQGRTQFSFSEIGVVRIAGGLALFVALYYFHEYAAGVPLL